MYVGRSSSFFHVRLPTSYLGSQLRTTLAAEIPSSNLAWTVVVARIWRKAWATSADARGRTTGRSHAVVGSCVILQGGGCAGAAKGGGGQGGEGQGEGEGLRGREDESVV